MGNQQGSDSSSPETEAQVWNTVTLGKYSWCTSLCNRGPAGTQLPQGYLIWVSKTIKYIINNLQPGINTYNPIKSFCWCQKPWESTRLPGGKNKNTSLKELQSCNSVSALSKTQLSQPLLLMLCPCSCSFPFRLPHITDLDAFCTSAEERQKDRAPDCKQQNPHKNTPLAQKKKCFFAWFKAAGQVFKHQYSSTGTHISGPLKSHAMTRVSKACTN